MAIIYVAHKISPVRKRTNEMNVTHVYHLAQSVAELAIDFVDRRTAWDAYVLVMLAPDLAHHAVLK